MWKKCEHSLYFYGNLENLFSNRRFSKERLQVFARIRAFTHRNLLGRTRTNDRTASVTALGSEVDDMVRRLDHVEIMLDDEHGIAVFAKAIQNGEQLCHVVRMKSRRRLIENIDGLARAALGKLGRKLDSLRLAARKGRGRLPDLDVAETNVVKGLELSCELRHIVKKLQSLLHGHIEHVKDVFALVFDFKGVLVVAFTVAGVAGHVNVGEKVHLDTANAVALAHLTASALDVKGEASRGIASRLRVGSHGKKLADIRKKSRIGRGIRARCASDGALVDGNDLVKVFDALDAVKFTGERMCAVQLSRKLI